MLRRKICRPYGPWLGSQSLPSAHALGYILPRLRRYTTLLLVLLTLTILSAQSIPKVWDDDALASLELPLVQPQRSSRHIAASYYYRIPARSIYKSYPIYAPGKEPRGYMEWLQRQEPEIIFDPAKLRTKSDWINAGEMVFDAPIGYGATFKIAQVRDPEWYSRIRPPLRKDGVMPFSRYVIRKKGVVEVGSGGCVMCHARVMPDGSFLKGAQGNFPVDRVIGDNLRRQARDSKAPEELLAQTRLGQRAFFAVPWLNDDPSAKIDAMSLEEIASAYAAIPPGVSTRVNLSLFSAAQVPSLIGIGNLKHLDHTGIVNQRSIEDLMRYVALVQGANSLDRYGDFTLFDSLPDPSRLDRYSDEQLYALAQYLYALKPPPNPNKFNSAARRGRDVFSREGCVQCHTPPLYTNNGLIPVEAIGTDSTLALQTRKGTGYYKVPSLRGVWYRGPLQHNGAAATLEEWFDPGRLSRIPGHPFGLELSADDRRALIAFLRTL